MKIEQISIKNYRSIKDKISIITKPIARRSCYTILGVNESGKSNILKSVSLLEKDAKVEYGRDCNKDSKKALSDNSIEMTFHLRLETEKYKEILKDKIDEKIISTSKITDVQKKVEINKTGVRTDFYHICIKDNKIFSEYTIDGVSKNIKLIKDVYVGPEKVTQDNIKTILGPTFDILDKDMLEEFLQNNLGAFFDINLPRVIFWEPKDEYLITKPIDLNTFKDSQINSIPLRNIFWLSGIKNIKERIETALKEMGSRAELEKELGKNATAYINEIWPEHKINIIVRIDGNVCEVYIEDKDKLDTYHNMEHRSDGFRQFITIALNIASENKSESLKNTIILLDEPETHLHPSGVRYLRDVLLKISENNLVFIATHSPYMIDKINLERNIRVFKGEGSVTNIKKITKDNPYEEEVIYEALGTSIYEFVSPNVLIFEGKTDKDIFDLFIKKITKNSRQDFDTISADSADKIPYYTKFFNGKRTKGFVLVDSDVKGKKIKEQIIRDSENYNNSNVFEINDVVSGSSEELTLEDLLPLVIITGSIKELYKIDITIHSKKPVVPQIISKLKDDRVIGNSQKDEAELKIKLKIFENVRKDVSKLSEADLDKKYKKYLSFARVLSEKIK